MEEQIADFNPISSVHCFYETSVVLNSTPDVNTGLICIILEDVNPRSGSTKHKHNHINCQKEE